MRPSYKIHLKLNAGYFVYLDNLFHLRCLRTVWALNTLVKENSTHTRHSAQEYVSCPCNTHKNAQYWLSAGYKESKIENSECKKLKINWWPNLKCTNALTIFSLALSSLVCSVHVLGLCVSLILIGASSFSNAQLMFNTDDTGFSKGNPSNPYNNRVSGPWI